MYGAKNEQFKVVQHRPQDKFQALFYRLNCNTYLLLILFASGNLSSSLA
ncbi:hypothetical protein SAMN05421813_103184 [Daejeonella rubra]|uniref:Uncharacterized protein n=1 Tax=Daejeonella rubra TaxID=990371 RepID=A0A1G9NVL5_9SPHI|nr:hypothetical protein SAMN05421813_103184 [Daejeonella rubra]